MPLSKVETLTDTLIDGGYIKLPRTIFCGAEFRERSELLVMSSLYLFGTGAAFRSCQLLCSISTPEVRRFFFVFVKAHYAMKDGYIHMPTTITELN
jgi:hypothetical protein